MYTCTKCNESHPPELFGGWPKNKWCKPCAADYQRTLRRRPGGYTPSGRNKAINATDDPVWERKLRRALVDARGNARSRNLEFGISRDDLPTNTACAISGLPMSADTGSPWIVSIDRINSRLGYIPGNIQLVCWAVNRAKGDLDNTEFAVLCAALGRLAQD